jgi:D-alanine-D-alanine ligase
MASQHSLLLLYNQPVLPADHPDAGSEHDILETADDTYKSLRKSGFDVTRLAVSYDPQPLLDALKSNRPDAVFNLFEGIATQTGTEVSVAALLEWLNVPFTGCPSACLSLGRDKARTKYLLSAAGIPTPEYLVVDSLPVPRWRKQWPAIVKPACQDASVGIDQNSVVTSQKQLDDRVQFVFANYGGPVVVERFIFGREFHVNMIEGRDAPNSPPRVLPLCEIEFTRNEPGHWPVYTFTAKWHENSEEYLAAPVRTAVSINADDFSRLELIAQRAFRVLQCRDYARIDVRMDAEGRFYVLEMNPNPYLNSVALVDGLKAIGRSHDWLLAEMSLAAIARGSAVTAATHKAPEEVVTV